MTLELLRANEIARVEAIRKAAGIKDAKPFKLQFGFERNITNPGGKFKPVYANDGRRWESVKAASVALCVAEATTSYCCRLGKTLAKHNLRLSYVPFKVRSSPVRRGAGDEGRAQ